MAQGGQVVLIGPVLLGVSPAANWMIFLARLCGW